MTKFSERYKLSTKASPSRNARTWRATFAYADDVVLFALSRDGLQKLFTVFEQEAEKVGLKINMGKGKTERFVIDNRTASEIEASGDDLPIVNKIGTPVPVVTSYKYLGRDLLDPEADWRKKSGRCWAALREYDHVWRSTAPRELKRKLAFGLIIPILTYALCTAPLTVALERRIHGAVGRMLRYALDVKRQENGDYEITTEEVYGPFPLILTQLQESRLSFIGHALRAHFHREVPTAFPLCELFDWEPPDCKRRRPRNTFVQTVKNDMAMSGRVYSVLELIWLADRRTTWCETRYKAHAAL